MRVILLLMLLGSLSLDAQEIRAGRIRQIHVKDAEVAYLSAVSPDGKHLIVSGPGYKGIFMVDKRGGRGVEISDAAGAGFEPRFSEDGRYLFFRSDEFQGGKKYSSLTQYDILSGEEKQLTPPSRNMASVSVSGNTIRYRANDESEKVVISTNMLKSESEELSVILEDLMPVIYIGSERRPLRPNGEGSYIWASLSPDRSKLLYYFTGKGAFVSDLEGSIICSAGLISAPKWLNNNIIIGMEDKDDGYRVTLSEIVCFSLDKNAKTTLTATRDRAEMYPLPFPDGRSIAFQTPEGGLWIMKINIK